MTAPARMMSSQPGAELALTHSTMLAKGSARSPLGVADGRGGDVASASYAQSLAQAQQLIGGAQPPNGLHPERSSMGRDRQADQQLRESMQREAMQDPQLAIQLGILEALERLHGSKKGSAGASTLEELLYGSTGVGSSTGMGEDDFAKLLSGAKGSAALLKLSQAIEQEPQLWVEHFNQTI
eukprot:6487101-Amphidinium_carterae.1